MWAIPLACGKIPALRRNAWSDSIFQATPGPAMRSSAALADFLERDGPGRRLLNPHLKQGRRFLAMTTKTTFEQVAQEHDAMIKRIAFTYEAAAPLAEELVQEIYFALWRALPSFRGASSLRTFVARIATNRAVTHVARAARMPRTSELSEHLPAAGGNPEVLAIALDREARLMTAVRSLPIAYRQTALLTLEGLTTREISEVLGLTVNAVAIRLSRAKTLLREILGE
jgi:RNA polymerase sigma factor (sigma-70 family)